nr:MAG TPA: Major capsid protein [Microviridae sp.]
MAQNVFDATFDANNRIDVNSFDWSHVNNLTTDFGRITPVFCELVPAKGSLRVNPEFGLELMPMAFPVQTRMFARLNFFKVTLRSMWEDYSDFISNFRDDLEEPYIKPSSVAFPKMCTTGSLGDYLGLPTKTAYSSPFAAVNLARCSANSYLLASAIVSDAVVSSLNQADSFVHGASCSASGVPKSNPAIVASYPVTSVLSNSPKGLTVSFTIPATGLSYVGNKSIIRVMAVVSGSAAGSSAGYSYVDISATAGSPVSGTLDVKFEKALPSASFLYLAFSCLETPSSTSPVTFGSTVYAPASVNVRAIRESNEEVLYDNYPFATATNPSAPRLLAYRFRAYEAVYNAYYRDIRNNPFVVNGRPVYNKWLPNMKGGADTTLYELHQCNWERDFLTTAVPNPQQGANAPLVGLVMGDVVTRADDGTYSVQKQTVLVDEDGSKYGLSYKVSEDGERLVGVDYDPVSEKTPVTAINSYAELAALATEQGSGFTIETLRYVNAYQKFLELNMRKGFSYKQIMQGRWDIDIRFDELLMPEFIGGISRELSMRTVEQTVDQQNETSQGQYAEALGSKTGIAGVYGSTSNNIEVFCDEESYIIGLLTVTPVPVYSQLLPKDFTYNGLLDHYQPEFDRIGFQPITYKEVCPMNFTKQNVKDMDKTFGYQRPWYEYVAKYDSSHGLFRDSMRNFIMSRFFASSPELSKQFLLVDPDTVNQVFSVTEYTDKIFGYVKFNATARLPISRVAIPRLD